MTTINEPIDMNSIIAFENNPAYAKNINRPFSIFHNTSDYYENHLFVKRGLAICHGHNHSLETLRKIKFINYWYFIDILPDTYPDYIADAADIESMKYFPDDYFYTIVTEYCPVVRPRTGLNEPQFIDILKNLHRILREDGYLFLTGFPFLIFWLIAPAGFDGIKKHINASLDQKTIDKMIAQYIADIEQFRTDALADPKIYNLTTAMIEQIYKNQMKTADHDAYIQIMQGAFDLPAELKTYLKNISIKYTRKILKECGYRIVGKKSVFTICKKV